MSGASAALSIRGARKVYAAEIGGRPRVAVDDVSIEVPQGGIHGLLGPNGAGKTTTLKMLLGLVRPTAGTFSVFGEPSTSRTAKSQIGFLPEQPYFPSQLTAFEAMKLYSDLSGIPARERRPRIADLLARVGLEGRAEARVSEYSRGMLQRLGIAQALLSAPRVVILDEPASGLDPIGQRDVRNLMLSLKEDGTTVLLSSHQLSEIEVVCDRVTVLDRGGVASEGRLDDLLNVQGRTSVRATGLEALPSGVAALADDVAASGGIWVFSIPDDAVRHVVDLIDDAGGQVLAVNPKRESLEDYYARMLSTRPAGEAAS